VNDEVDLALVGEHPRGASTFVRHLVEVDGPHGKRPGVDVGERQHEHVVHNSRQAAHLRGDDFERLPVFRLLASRTGQRHLRRRPRDRHRRAQLV
jgi:hypothetical protein